MSTVCCPKFNPAPWDETTFTWKDKKFIKGSVFTLMYIPMNFGNVIRRMDAAVQKTGATILDNICLSDHTSKWNMDIYLAVDREIPGAQNVTLSGEFLSKVYEGPFQDTGKWGKDFAAFADRQKASVRKMYMWYTTCPKCAKKYGNNYVVIVAQVA